MSDFTKSLTEKYRAEVRMIQDVLTNFQNVYKSVLPNSRKEYTEIKFTVPKDPRTNEYSLAGNPEAMILLVSICKMLLDTGEQILKSPEFKTHLQQTVQESITNFINPISEEAFKKCPGCDFENKYNAKYCSECGSKL
jgi:hypothetical protein